MTIAEQTELPIRDPIHKDTAVDTGYMLALFLDNRGLIGLITLAVMALGVVYSLLATPIYQADALLQVEIQGPNLGQSSLGSILDQESAESSAHSEILGSRMVMRVAGVQAGLDLVVQPDTWPLIGGALLRAGFERPGFATGSGSVWAGESIAVDSLNVTEELHGQSLKLTVLPGNRYHLLDEETGTLLGEGTAGELMTRNNPFLELSVSEINAPAGATFTLIRPSEQSMILNLQNRFEAIIRGGSRGGDTGIIELRLTGTDREETRRSLNAIAEVYVAQNIDRHAEAAANRLTFLETQTPELRESLTTAENTLMGYRASRESVDLSLETESMLRRLVDIEIGLNELELKENELSQRFTISHPNYQILLGQRSQLQKEHQRLEAEIDTLPEIQQQVLRLNRDVEVTQEIYTQMLNIMQELRIATAGIVGNVRILDDTLVSAAPIAPRPSYITLVSVLSGLMLGIGVVSLRNMQHRGIMSVNQIQNHGLQVYATIPLSEKQLQLNSNLSRSSPEMQTGERARTSWFKFGGGSRNSNISLSRKKNMIKKGGLLASTDYTDMAVEALRSLRTSLYFAMLEAENNVLMLTGPTPGVGKSFVSTNLAAVCAHAGQRVLIIDGDLRKGHVHNVFKGSSANGLSELLAGKIELAKAIRPSGMENLDYISKGMTPPNPSELLMTERFSHFVDSVNEQYDLVIIDTPPTLAVTDSAVIGAYAGTTLIVMRYQQNVPVEIERTVERLHNAGVSVRGAILNAIERSAVSSYHQGYGYRYGYGYGYGYKDGYGYGYRSDSNG